MPSKCNWVVMELRFYKSFFLLTLRAPDGGAALPLPLLHLAVLSYWLDEWTDLEVAHEHRVSAGAVQAGLRGQDLLALRVVLVLVVASCVFAQKEKNNS